VAQYQLFVQAGGYADITYWTQAGWRWRTQNDIKEPEPYSDVYQIANHPQVGVSWYEAMAYCCWLSVQMSRNFRLPSEAEWERAARYIDGRRYPWGNTGEPAKHSNTRGNGIDTTSTVGMFPSGHAVNGAADMVGNVLEWCSTKWRADYQEYEEQADDELSGEEHRVLRGGGWSRYPLYVRCACRHSSDPQSRYYNVGFRIVGF
jgi:formylglycine-generating enzyme required for sulfatase activity